MTTVISHVKTSKQIPSLVGADETSKVNDPSLVSLAYSAQCEDWTMIRDCIAGTGRLRTKAAKYLPQHFREHADNYKDRVARATFLNVVEDAIDNVVAHPFEKEFALTEDSSEAAHVLALDIDAQGNDLHTFARRAFRNGITDGFVSFLVEHTTVPAGATLADEINFGSRPYLVEVPAQKLLAAYCEMRGSEKIVTHARIAEEKTERKGFLEKRFDCVRVYDVRSVDPANPEAKHACHWELWQRGNIDQPSSTAWELVDEGILWIAPNVAWDRVPLFTWYAGKFVDDFHAKPPFLDLVHKNLQHFRTESDYDNIERQTCYPMLSVRPPSDGGISNINVLNPDTDEAGDRTTFQPGPDAILVGDYYYCQPDAGVFSSIQARMENLIAEMKGMALDPISNKRPGNATATEKSIEASQAKSHLHEWAISFSGIIDQAIGAMLYWVGKQSEVVETIINTDFKISTADTSGSTLMQYYMARIISRQTVWEESKRKGILGPTFDAEYEPQRLADEAPDFAEDEQQDDDPGARDNG